MVDIIDIRQWHYRNDGSLYEPQGGCSLAPRQWARLIDPGTTSCESIYRAVYEYRSRYPEKAVTYNAAMPRNIEGNAANWAISWQAVHWQKFLLSKLWMYIHWLQSFSLSLHLRKVTGNG